MESPCRSSSEILYAQQIVDIDWYLSKPLKDYDPSFCYLSNSSIKCVPILRIFGSTPSKQSACLHIHGVFPYLYMPLPPKVDPSLAWLRELRRELDEVINKDLDTDASCHVYDIKIITGKQFYGYHADRETFLQIFLYDPSHIRILANLLLTGEILDMPIQPHEAHIPFTLQFLIDYNLYGMGFIYLEKLQFRATFEFSDVNSSSIPHNPSFLSRVWCTDLLEKENMHPEPRHSSCQLEGDTLYHSILNPSLFASVDNPGMNMIWEDEKERRRMHGVSCDITIPLDIERHVELSVSEKKYMNKFKIVLQARNSFDETHISSFNSTTEAGQKTTKEPSNAFLLLSPPSVTIPGDENIVSILSELDMGTNKDECRLLNLDGQIVTLPSNLLADSQSYFDAHTFHHSSYKSDDTISQKCGTSLPFSQIQSYNISLIRHSFITAASDYLPSEGQGFIFNCNSHLSYDTDLVLLENMIEESNNLSQPLSFNFELYYNSENPPFQLDGTGRRGRPRQKSNSSDFKSGTTSVFKKSSELSIAASKTLKKRSTTLHLQSSATRKIPLIVRISKSGFGNNHPFSKYPILQIPRIDLSTLSSVHGSGLIYKKKDRLESKSVSEELMDISFSPNYQSLLPFRKDIILGDNIPEVIPNIDSNFNIHNEISNTPAISEVPESDHLIQEKEISQLILVKNDSIAQSKPDIYLSPLNQIATDPFNVENSRILVGNRPSKKQTIEPLHVSSTNDLSCTLKSIDVVPVPFYYSSKASSDDNTAVNKDITSSTEINKFDSIAGNPRKSRDISEENVNHDGIISTLLTDTSPKFTIIESKSHCISNSQNLSFTKNDFPSESRKILDNNSLYSCQADLSAQDPMFAKVLDSIPADTKGLQILSSEQNDYQFSVSPISEKQQSLSSLLSSSGMLCSNSTSGEEQIQIKCCSPGLVDKNMHVIKQNSEFSSVSSETVSDNVHSLIGKTREEESRKKSFDCISRGNERINQTFLKENIHSTPLVLQKPESSSVISEDLFSPISKEEQQSNLSKQSVLTEPQSESHYSVSNNLQFEGEDLAKSQNFQLCPDDLRDITVAESRVGEYLTIMSVEILIRTRNKLFPDPHFDSVLAICYDIYTHKFQSSSHINGIISLNDTWDIDDLKKIDSLALSTHNNVKMTHIASEIELFQEFINTVLEYDPDICVGYEYQYLSWGYLIERASLLQLDLLFCLSRVQPPGKVPRKNLKAKPYNFNYSDPKIVGRILINLWRICKYEVSLNNYSFENVAFNVLHRRFPLFSYDVLTKWYTIFPSLHRWSSLNYYLSRAKANLLIIDALNIVGHTSELARLFGIEFYSVLSRGTQYRVESMMIRLLKRYEYIVVSPSVRQRSKMLPPSEIPLVMEPIAPYFNDPVVVLDFQSLYPSIIIAYNYCYSTCLGRLENLKCEGKFNFGATELNIPSYIIEKLNCCDVNISPNGVVFVKSHVRRGMLPIMLDEILKTRIMLKQAMKKYKSLPLVRKQLNIRQIGLKLIANVTYGYTHANFSGRMPCVELGDSIVAKARETLEMAIQLVNSSSEWNARVIYGDTDSLFVHLPGYSKSEAFNFGAKLTDIITKLNPKPIKLKFEKVYQPCLFMSKKRYVGFSFESEEQEKPYFDAKGIETVRRDSCPFVSRLLHRSLKLFFRTNDVSEVRKYVIKNCYDLFSGSVSIQDFIFTREFRGIHGYQSGIITHSLHLSLQKVHDDPRSEPRIGSRIPYLYVYGNPVSPLIDLVRTPEQVILDSSLLIHLHYYLHHHIFPALARAFNKVGANVENWIKDIPRKFRPLHSDIFNPIENKSLSLFVDSNFCVVCDREKVVGLCQDCATDSQRKHSLIGKLFQDSISRLQDIRIVCKACLGDTKSKECESTDCHIYFKRMRLAHQLTNAKRLSDLYLYNNIDLTF